MSTYGIGSHKNGCPGPFRRCTGSLAIVETEVVGYITDGREKGFRTTCAVCQGSIRCRATNNWHAQYIVLNHEDRRPTNATLQSNS